MQYTAKTLDAIKQRSHCLVVTCYEGAKLSDTAAAVNAAGQQQLEALIKREEFQGKAGQTLLLLNPAGIAADRLLVLGLGATDKQGAISADNFRKAVARIPDALKSTPSREITACLGEVRVKDQDITWQARQHWSFLLIVSINSKARLPKMVLHRPNWSLAAIKSSQLPPPADWKSVKPSPWV